MNGGATLLIFALVALACATSALDAGEVTALNAMRASWGASVPANWTGSPSCAWEGIGCGLEGHVVEVQMGSFGLVGVIPPEMGLLLELRNLNLSGNQHVGIIPPVLGNLSRLQIV